MTKYTVEAWWQTTRQATTQIEAESVEQAVEIARRMVNESDPFIENNKDCYDDGPTNLTIWDAAMAQQLAEAPSKEQRLSEAAPRLLAALSDALHLLGQYSGHRYHASDRARVDDLLATLAAARGTTCADATSPYLKKPCRTEEEARRELGR